jgi:ribose 5-phosphate isomerase B
MSSNTRIVIGADHAGFRLKERLVAHLKEKGFAVEDIGCYSEDSVDYPNIAGRLAEVFRAQQAQAENVRGVLCCGSGIGICMSANRYPWIRAVVTHEHNTAVMSRRHNDSNVICFGGRVIAPELAFDLFDTWLATPFEGGRHQKRVDMMTSITVENQGDPQGVPSC